jgi:hypothetical protein
MLHRRSPGQSRQTPIDVIADISTTERYSASVDL